MKQGIQNAIETYSFGEMTIEGRTYTSDLILFPDGRIQDNWWREEGHMLKPGDIMDLIETVPEKLIIGTGANGMMQVSEDVVEQCRHRGIEVVACPTSEAVYLYNKALEDGDLAAACFHLTC